MYILVCIATPFGATTSVCHLLYKISSKFIFLAYMLTFRSTYVYLLKFTFAEQAVIVIFYMESCDQFSCERHFT